MIGWGTERPAVILALAGGIVVSGAVAFGKLPLSTRSEVELPKLAVNAHWDGASPELMETYIISPMEGAVQGLHGVRRTTSNASEGNGSITIELDPHADVTLARLGVLERKETLRSTLPANATIEVGNFVPDELQAQALLEVNITGPYTPGTLGTMVRDGVIPALTNVPGIASVRLNGSADNGLTVAYDPVFLHQLNIDPSDLQLALGTSSQVAALGIMKSGTRALPVAVHDQPRVVEDIGRLPVTTSGGRVFALHDLARIVPEEDAHGQFYRINGRTSVTISMYRQPLADAIKTAAIGRAAVDSLQKSLPPGVRLSITHDESEELAAQLRDLIVRGGIAFISVFIVLLITLRSLSGAALVIASAGIAIAGAALSLYLLHIPANLLTLAGLGMGIGILVQNGLVVVERLRAAKNSAASRAETGRRIAPAVLGSTLTTTVVLLPFLYLQGNTRAVFAPFAAAFALALFWSVGTALVFVPAVGRGQDGRVKGWPRLAALYARMVAGTLRWRRLSIAITVIILGVLSWGFINKVPRTDWGRNFGTPRQTVTASVGFPRGSDPQIVQQMISELESAALGQPGVALVRAQGSTLNGNVDVEFTAAGSQSDAPWSISDRLTERAVLIGGTDHVYVSRPEGNGFSNGSGGGGAASRSIVIRGYSYSGVLALAEDLKRRLEQIPRVREVNVNAGSGSRGYGGQGASVLVALIPDRTALARIGASVAQFSNSVSRQINGSATQRVTLPIGDQMLPVSLRAEGATDRDIRQLQEGDVSNTLHVPTRIGDVSSVGEVQSLASIDREDQQYIRKLSYDFRGPQKMADRTHKAFMQSITTPAGYVVADDQYQYRADDSSKGLVQVFLLGTVLVLLAVALVFDSVWAAAMVFLSLPMALGGVVAAFWITKTAFTREAAVGVILVVGLAVNHAILLIDAALHRRRENNNRLTVAGVLDAATDRVTMIVLVTLTTLASLTPMAAGTKADTMFGAIALATAGGTIAGTLGVMFILPPMLLGLRRKLPPVG